MFKSQAGHNRHSVANGSPSLRNFFGSRCVVRVQRREDGPLQLVTRFGLLQPGHGMEYGFSVIHTGNFHPFHTKKILFHIQPRY